MTIAGIFALFMTFGAYYSGALTHLYYADGLPQAIMVDGKPNLDQLMPNFIMTQFPHAFVLLILLLVFSASMSSLSSLVLVSSSAIAIDIYGAFVNRHVNQKQTMLLMRLLCGVFVALSLILAMNKVDVIVNLMVMSWGALAGVFLAPYIFGLFWRRTTKAGAYAGIITGLASAFALFVLWGKDGIPLAGAITMFLPLIVVPLVSLITRPLPKETVDAAFGDADRHPQKANLK
jgi:Na+/proline symporter